MADEKLNQIVESFPVDTAVGRLAIEPKDFKYILEVIQKHEELLCKEEPDVKR